MLQCLIFSKDRPHQLYALLKSIDDNFKELFFKNISILWKATNSDFLIGYKKVQAYFPEINFIEEKNFMDDFKNILRNWKSDYFLCLVDDDIVVNDFEVSPIFERFANNPDIACYSLRLHDEVTYSYTAKVNCPQPNFLEKFPYLLWDWKICKAYSEWGYVCNISGHIFPIRYVKSILLNNNFKGPNSLEGVLSINRKALPCLMMSSAIPKIITIPINKVQIENKNHSGENPVYSIDSLNNKFLNNEIINYKEIYGKKFNAPHGEFNFTFV